MSEENPSTDGCPTCETDHRRVLIDRLVAELAEARAEVERLRSEVEKTNIALRDAISNEPGDVAQAYRDGWVAGSLNDQSLKSTEWQPKLAAATADTERMRVVFEAAMQWFAWRGTHAEGIHAARLENAASAAQAALALAHSPTRKGQDDE